MYLIGYDIGSSTIKASLVDAGSGQVVGVIQYPDTDMDMLSRQSGWAEQQPEVWWQDFCFATRKLLSQTFVDPQDIKGIGIGYQMHGLVLIDRDHHVLRPSIIWCDSRAVSIGNQAFHEIGEKRCLEKYLNSPGNFTASKLKWVKDNEPHIYDRTYKLLLPGDFIAMKLTGQARSTISGLSEGIFWDFGEHKVADDILEHYELNEDLIPEIIPTFSEQGQVTKLAEDVTGLKAGTTVTYRAGDQPNNALSLNVLEPGEVAATSGTSGVVYGIVDRPIYDPKSRVNAFAHVNYEDNFDRIGVLLCINGAGIQYSWMKHQVARSDRTYGDMERMAASVPVGSDGLCVLPFGNGSERILDNKNLNAHIYNLEFNRHNRAHLYRAALEGVAFSFVYGINILKEMGLNIDIMRVANDNMFQSDVFSTTIATLLESQIEVVDTTGATGAARAAGVAAGVYNNLKEALDGIKPAVVHEPVLNPTQCRQAYNYWLSSLDKALDENPAGTKGITSLKNRNEELVNELNNKQKQLTSNSMQMINRDNLLMEIKDQLLALQDGTANVSSEIRRIIAKIDHSLDNKDWAEFEEHFNLIHSDFFKKLKTQLPGLTMSEVKLSALLKMRMTTKEIASFLNLSVRGVETRRYRLRKKIDLKSNQSLEDYLEKV